MENTPTTFQYLKNIIQRYKTGKATEHSYRGDLQQLIESLVPNVQATNEPKRQACGAPDYILLKKDIPIGFIEAKNIGDNDLEGKKKTGNKEQFDRYKDSLNNLIFTDYLHFHWYRNGGFVKKITIADFSDQKITPLPENFPLFENFVKEFCSTFGQTIKNSKNLAEIMAGKARLLANVIEKSLTNDKNKQQNSTLQEQVQAFKELLIHDIDAKTFSDIYAQTIAYGLFAARLNDSKANTFSRQQAAELIPKTNPFLRKLFGYIAGPDIDDRIRWIVDNLVQVFLACDVEELLKNYGKSTQTEAPIIHFYEDFLAQYDPKLRKSRGVWYTPAPVVGFIVRAVHDILKNDFDLSDGLGDTQKTLINPKDKKQKEVHKVQILDPAAGTGTFLAEIVKQIYEQLKSEGRQGIWNNYVDKHLLPRLNGFELLMASYAMAHLQLDVLLKETGYDRGDKNNQNRQINEQQRFKIYLTNSLEEAHPDTRTFFASWLSNEANEANHIKRDTPVMCIIGNPPYSGESVNKGTWIMNLMEDYKKEPGGKVKLKERNPKWLNDDYVKFLRYGQYFIEKNGSGILAFITPHGFLDNPTFRGMRWNILKTYDKIYTLDLHGNSKKKELAPDGSQDQNVFDIMQGVSITIFVKTGKKKQNDLAKVFHHDLFGNRKTKFDFLSKHNLKTTPFKKLTNKAPMYFMVHKSFKYKSSYDKGFKINELFPLNSVGIVTGRDKFSIDNSKKILKQRLNDFVNLDTEEARIKYNLGADSRDWKVQLAQQDLKDTKLIEDNFRQIHYRPFDFRWTYYTGRTKGFHCMPRKKIMQHFIERDRYKTMQHFLKGENVGLVTVRRIKTGNNIGFFITSTIGDDALSGMSSSVICPLYLYPNGIEIPTGEKRLANLNSKIVSKIAKKIHLTFTNEKKNIQNTFAPIDILDYVYAVLHKPSYREKYKAFLKIDFPKIPYPKNEKLFWQLVDFGQKLRQLHLLESIKIDTRFASYPQAGDHTITTSITKKDWQIFDKKKELSRIWLNEKQYFDKIPVTAWNFYIGGYQPAQKWLKDRKGQCLSYDDIEHYQKIITVLYQTDKLMKTLDKIEIE